MRVLVTGGTGYIGSHTLVELHASDHEIVVLDNLSNSTVSVLDHVQRLSNRSTQLEIGDIRDEQVLNTIMHAFRPEAVVHFAGLKSVGESREKPLEYYDVNVSGTRTLLSAMDSVACRRIIFSSSAAVYGADCVMPCKEDATRDPASVYGRTKMVAEDLLTAWAGAQPEATAVLLRYFNPVGAHPSALIGEAPQGEPNNLMPLIAQVASGERSHLSIFGDDYDTPDGTCLRDYIHVVDLARAHVAALDYSKWHVGARAFNVGTGQNYSVREMVEAFARTSGRSIRVEIAARRHGDIPMMKADPSRAAAELGWQARLGLEEMTASTWAWQSRGMLRSSC